LCLHTLYAIAFLVLAALPFESQADLVSIATDLRLRGSCVGGSLLDVSEDLTYSLKSGFTTQVERQFQNHAEPANFKAEWVGSPVSVAIEEVVRKDPKKYAMDYESGQVTTVKLKFDAHYAKGNATSFTLRLRYVARLYGDTGECSDGGAICPGFSGWNTVKGWWEVPSSEDVHTSVALSGCYTSGNGSCHSNWEIGLGPAAKADNRWQVSFSAPTELGVGSDACPFAWELGSRNIWWVLTAVSLMLAASVCFCLMYGGGDGAVPGLFCIGCLVLMAFIFFMFALMSDFFFKKGEK